MSYEKGFIDKCAEYGVDPEVLLQSMEKSAEGNPMVAGLKDYLSGIFSNPFSWSGANLPQTLGKGTTLGGGALGLRALLEDDEEQQQEIPPEVLMAIQQRQGMY